MYVPRAHALDDPDAIRVLVRSAGSAELITVGRDGYPTSTLLPVLWDAAPGAGRLVFHAARANPHWRAIEPGCPALAVVTGVEAYVSPSWYPSKAHHGRVVPTWNYSAVHFRGRVTVHDDPAWVRQAVTRLTDTHEGHRVAPWAVTDAPAGFLDQQLRGIVGVELTIETVQAKAKLSQNRTAEDRRGVAEGLRRGGGCRERAMADLVDPAPGPAPCG